MYLFNLSLSKKIWSHVSEGAAEMAGVSTVQAVIQAVARSGANPTSHWNVLVQGGTVSADRADRDLPKDVHCSDLSEHTFWKSEVSCQMLSLGRFDSKSLFCHIKDIRRILSLACSGLCVPTGEVCPLCTLQNRSYWLLKEMRVVKLAV